MKKKIKLRDMTEEWTSSSCTHLTCEKCQFYGVNCITSSWINHKDFYSDKFLDQEVEIDVANVLTDDEKRILETLFNAYRVVFDGIRIERWTFVDDRSRIVGCYAGEDGCKNILFVVSPTKYLPFDSIAQNDSYLPEELGL